uniref:BED-type domain-containing protein n=1 Tax=Oryza punctata TaxID=4537 RepID=A0A0E0LRX9_ORYPU
MDPMDEHDSDELPVGVASDEAHVAFRAKTKKRSKVWDEYKPIYVNGVVQSAECRYCHILMSCKGSDGHSNGTSHLWRHQKICRAKEELDLAQLHDSGFPYDSLDDIKLASHSDNSRFRSKVWEEFTPVYVEGRIQGAECFHCHKRLSADKGRSHLNRHTQTCPARGESGKNHKGPFSPSSAPSFKSGVQDELSPALTNGKVQIAEYASKLLKVSPVDKTPHSQHILALPARDNMAKEQNASSTHAVPDVSTRKFDQETSYQELTRMIVLHGYPLSIVEHEEMKRFAKSLNPLFNMASSIDVEDEIRNHEGTTKLKDMLIQKNSLPIRGELYNIACVDDVLNNIISKGQSMLHLVDNILERFMLAHAYSSLTQQQLFEAVTNMGLKCPQEDAKRWHKIYFRLEVVLHCKKSFPSEELLPAEDYKVVESICKILRAFYRAIEVISGPVCPAANVYFNELWKAACCTRHLAAEDLHKVNTHGTSNLGI